MMELTSVGKAACSPSGKRTFLISEFTKMVCSELTALQEKAAQRRRRGAPTCIWHSMKTTRRGAEAALAMRAFHHRVHISRPQNVLPPRPERMCVASHHTTVARNLK